MIGLVVAGIASGVGKTTLTLGLIAALQRRGMTVQPYKVGPDYIDPGQHAQVAGRPSRNLDSWQLPEPALRELFARSAATADVALVEGVMGLFDGRTGEGETGSTAHVAKLLGLPVLLVVDAAKAARSVAATVLGCQQLDPALRLIGVVLNNVASARHAEIGREAIESLTDVPVLGWLPRDRTLRQDERYLGLVPASERLLPTALVAGAGDQVEQHVDLQRLLQLAAVEAPRVVPSGLFPAEPIPPRVRIALAQDEAFNFYYQDSLDLLAAWGAELVPFSPLHDTALPASTGGIYLGGGFPELFGAQLAANAPILAAIRHVAATGLPIYGECGGLMYLQQALTTADGERHPMLGLVQGESTLSGKRLTLGYREARARRDSMLLRAGETVRGHEFHYSVTDAPPDPLAAYDVLGGPDRAEGFVQGNILGSYLHLHFGSDARLAPRFVDACAATKIRAGTVEQDATRTGAAAMGAVGDDALATRAPASTAIPGPLLRRHGLPPAEIEVLSRQRIEAALAARLPPDEPVRGLVARLVYAAGDADLIERVALRGDPISAAVSALAGGANLVVDVGMVAAGISRPMLAALGVGLHVAIQADDAETLARQHGITRSAAGIFSLAEQLDGAVVAIGNAPTALLALLDLIQAGAVRPAAIIAMPVGFVAADESKEHALLTDIPCVTVRGTRGGSALAAAAANHLLRLAQGG